MRDRLRAQIAGLDAEIAVLMQDGGVRALELNSGQRDPSSGGPGGVYSFVMEDALALPEDATGTLRVGGASLSAFVVAQEGNRVWVLVETTDPLPAYVPSARLELSSANLLEKLKDRIGTLLTDGEFGLGPEVFGERDGAIGFDPLPARITDRVGQDSMRTALEQALGSTVTFLWGPPGTGKTFAIAALTARLADAEETVLVTSHTHAAVEQALWAAVEPPGDGRQPGLLYGSRLIDAGRVLKVGATRDAKIPDSCQFDVQLKELGQKNRDQIDDLMAQRSILEREQAQRHELLDKWAAADAIGRAAAEAAASRRRAATAVAEAERTQHAARGELDSAKEALKMAEASVFFLRRGRVERAQQALRSATRHVAGAETGKATAARQLAAAQTAEAEASRRAEEAASATASLPQRSSLNAATTAAERELERIQRRIDELRKAEEEFASRLLHDARAVFATLTKLYMDPQLRARQWDTVVVDEASMAMPPLVAFAASRARKRVVIAGDFYQLPPIVQSREGPGYDELGVDLFHLRGIAELVQQEKDHPQLARLHIQRRMRPAIAEVARGLAYKSELVDHPDTAARPVPQWCTEATSELVGESARNDSAADGLLVVDIAALNSWAGKSKGSMSRFNFHSAQASVELAALYAARIPRPDPGDAPPVGIITPYAAQRRYLTRLVHALALDPWVAVGTVHTFQGNECDVIVFDSVLAEPYYTARLTNPHVYQDVRRDLNVAVTRARHQFLFVGDGVWLDRHAKPGSGYGTLWAHLKQVAPIVDATQALGEEFRARVASHVADTFGWGSVQDLGRVTLLDETDFYTAFLADLAAAREQVVLYTPYIGKRRWPNVEPHITAAAGRGVDIVMIHKPLSDDAWASGDPEFGKVVFDRLAAAGVTLIPLSGVHAKTVVIDERIVYEGSLNWASQVASYEHMMRIDSSDLAALHSKLLQQRDFVAPFKAGGSAQTCPSCGGRLMVISQLRQKRTGDAQPMKLACASYNEDRSCDGHLRGVDERAPFREPPVCDRGAVMKTKYSKSGRPWSWRCGHKTCPAIRFRRGDVEVA